MDWETKTTQIIESKTIFIAKIFKKVSNVNEPFRFKPGFDVTAKYATTNELQKHVDTDVIIPIVTFAAL